MTTVNFTDGNKKHYTLRGIIWNHSGEVYKYYKCKSTKVRQTQHFLVKTPWVILSAVWKLSSTNSYKVLLLFVQNLYLLKTI